MSGKVRAKFRVTQKITTAGWGPGQNPTHVVHLSPVTSGSPENEQFYHYTPSGRIELGVVNEETGNQFELGKEYYIDFTPAD